MESTVEYQISAEVQHRLLQIALQLGKLYSASRLVEVALAHKKEDLDGRRVYMAPAEGWPGKNEGERKIAAEKAYAADETFQAIGKLVRENEGQLAEMQGQYQALIEERRALEWMVRERMVEALQAAHVDSNGVGPVEERAFDDAMQAAALDNLGAQIEEELPF